MTEREPTTRKDEESGTAPDPRRSDAAPDHETSAPAPVLCRVCRREIDEDSLRTVCLPCAMKAQQDEAQRRHR